MSIRDVATVKESAPAEKSRHGSYRDTRSPIRLGIWILLVGFGGFLLWAAFAPLDEGGSLSGHGEYCHEAQGSPESARRSY